MPRTARAAVAGAVYHVLSRGNARATVFHDAIDYEAFVALVRSAIEHVPTDVLAFCLMPNHFHLVVRPHADRALGVWMQRLLTAHVKRHRCRYGTIGRIWQGRFKAFPIQRDDHLLTVLRYVERNPVRAGLVLLAAEWPWSSLRVRAADSWLADSPVSLGADWETFVDRPLTAGELEAVRRSSQRERPFGDPRWVEQTADQLELRSTLRNPGRQRRVSGPGEGSPPSIR